MKNDAPRKPMRVVLLDSAGEFEPGIHNVIAQGAAGILVRGRLRILTWSDEGRTWKRAEEAT